MKIEKNLYYHLGFLIYFLLYTYERTDKNCILFRGDFHPPYIHIYIYYFIQKIWLAYKNIYRYIYTEMLFIFGFSLFSLGFRESDFEVQRMFYFILKNWKTYLVCILWNTFFFKEKKNIILIISTHPLRLKISTHPKIYSLLKQKKMLLHGYNIIIYFFTN